MIYAVYTDQKLHEIIDEFGKLVPVHRLKNGKPGELILMPESQLNYLIGEIYELGFVDEKGNVHTGYFVCDNEGNKLNSRLKFDASGVSIRSRIDWARKFFDYELIYNGYTYIYQSNFFAAYTIRTGNKIHSNLQDTFLNLEHIEPTEQPLPNMEVDVRARGNNRIILRNLKTFKNSYSEIFTKSEEFAIVLNQLAGMYTLKQVDIGKIYVYEGFLNLNNEGDLHSILRFQEILASLKPKSGDLIYGDGSIADPTEDNYWLKHISRGFSDASGKFSENENPLTVDKFYEAWLNLIKNDLGRGTEGYFEGHRKNLESLAFTASEDVYKKIDTALEDVFGYTAFISLLAGIMTFSDDSSTSKGYQIDFWCHNNIKQIELLKKFVGRNLHDKASKVISRNFLKGEYRLRYFASLFLLGAKRGKRQIKPSSSFFLDGYFRKHNFRYHSDYKFAIDLFLHRSFSEYLGEVKKVQKLNEMNKQGRLKFYDFLAKKLNDALDKIALPNDEYRSFCFHLLMHRIIRPSSTTDIVSILRKILCSGTSKVITIGKASFEVTYDELIKITTPEMLFTMVFGYHLIRKRDISGYYLDFDLVWGNLAPKIHNRRKSGCYDILTDLLSKAPIKEEKLLEVEFYGRTTTGIRRIDKVNAFLSTTFSQFGFSIRPSDTQDLQLKVLSMLFWMMMEPNIVAVVKLPNGDNYLTIDIHGLHFENKFGKAIVGDFAPPSDYKEYQDKFKGIFKHSDIMSFANFHNHELTDAHGDIISYVMEKFKNFYVTYLGGDQYANLIDLR